MDYKKYLRTALLAIPQILMLSAAYFAVVDASAGERLTALVLIAILQALSAGYMYYEHRGLKFNQQIFISLVTAAIGSISFAAGLKEYLYMSLLVSVMLIGMIIDRRLAVFLNVTLVLAVGVVTGHGLDYILFYLIVGTVTAGVIEMARERHKMLIVMAGLAGFSALTYSLITYMMWREFDLISILVAMANIALSMIVVVGSLPLWESIFRVMTPLKMLEFASNDHKLMQRMLMEAPGTYHHVQMVGNLAERGAKAIGADGLLARTGAVFHDIGKLKEPIYFIENQNSGPNPHDDIAADDSARIIIEHVTYGVKLAHEHHLPSAITDIIEQHHGNSLVRYFYDKAQNYNDGVDYDAGDFMYDGPIPQTKEAAIVMLADCVEAFVRSLSEDQRNLEKIRWIVGEITRQKFVQGQLDDSGLTVGELKAVGNAFMQVYNGLYHDRINYPESVEAEV